MCHRRGNISVDSSTVAHFQWSILWLIGPWSIKRKSHTGCLCFLVIPCNRAFWSVTICCFGRWYQSFLLSLVEHLLFILLETDHIHLPAVSTPHLRHHHDDCVWMNRSQLDAEGKARICGPPLPKIYVLFGLCFCVTLSIWQVHIQTEQRNMTGSLLKCVAAFGKSCQRSPFGLEPALNYWIHHA